MAENTQEKDDFEWLTNPSKENTESSLQSIETSVTKSPSKDEDSSTLYSDDFFEDDADADFELDQLRTEEEKALLEENHRKNCEAEELQFQEKLMKANKQLEDEVKEVSLERERKVVFKPQLIDFEAPAPSESDSESEDEDFTKKSEDKKPEVTSLNDTVEINGQRISKSEKVLIERGGKFELVELSELETILPPLSLNHHSNDISVVNGDNLALNETNHKPTKTQRPKSAPLSKRRSTSRPPTSRPTSANNTFSRPPKKSRPFHYSAEMKDIMKKRLAAKAEREKEVEKRKAAEEEAAKKEAHEAWLAWKEGKEALRKEAQQKAIEKKRNEPKKDPEEAKRSYDKWLKEKKTLYKNRRELFEEKEIEKERQWLLRNRDDCDKAYRCWLRRKNQESKLVREQEELLQKETLRLEKQARKARKLLNALREAQEMKYIDYHG